MAVQDKYAETLQNSDGNTFAQFNPAIFTGGLDLKVAFNRVEVATADDANSVYRIFRDVPASIVPVFLLIGADAAIDIADMNIGLWKPNFGAVVSENCLADALNPSGGIALTLAAALNGLAAIAIDNRYKKLYEHGGHSLTTKLGAYDIGIKSISNPGAAGSITALLIFGQSG